MEKKFLSLKEIMEILHTFSYSNSFENEEVIKWIIVKTLRLKRDQFDYIKQIEVDDIEKIKSYILRYKNGESLSHIFGYIEFYGNYFDVTENVFDPRLSTEALIDEILKLDKDFLKSANIIDLCTGSGCIAITLSKLLNKKISAVDISPSAIEIAKSNTMKNEANVDYYEFDLNNDWNLIFNKNYDIIVANPPYWNPDKILNNKEIIRNNPLIAFDGGNDGLKYIKLIIENSYSFLNQNGYLVLEVDEEQILSIKQLLLSHNYKNITIGKDHKNIDRVIVCQK